MKHFLMFPHCADRDIRITGVTKRSKNGIKCHLKSSKSLTSLVHRYLQTILQFCHLILAVNYPICSFKVSPIETAQMGNYKQLC